MNILNKLDKKTFYFIILSALFIFFICKNIDIAFTFFISIVFACSLNPLVDKLSKKISRTWATVIVLLGTILIITICVLPILILGAYEITEFAKEFPNYITNLDNKLNSLAFTHSLGITNFKTGKIFTDFANSSSGVIENLLSFIESLSSIFLYVFTGIIFVFFLILDDKIIKENILRLFPKELREKTQTIIDNIAEKLSGYIMAQTVVCASVWITMTLGLLLFKIDYAIILGLIAGIMAMIPVVGSAISLIICLIATYSFGIKTLIIVTVLFTISHFIENHIVRPYVYSKFLNLHQIIIFLALFIGAKYAGVLGVLFAPPIAMAAYILLEELYIKEME